jgi:hypothetical protein
MPRTKRPSLLFRSVDEKEKKINFFHQKFHFFDQILIDLKQKKNFRRFLTKLKA